jgi:hypothetical protein
MKYSSFASSGGVDAARRARVSVPSEERATVVVVTKVRERIRGRAIVGEWLRGR